MSGEMRRPPQLWEQKLARTTAILGTGISSSGDATAIVPPTPAPGAGGGTEPAPVSPPAGSFTTPSTPTLIGAVQGINVVWNGLNASGELWPSDTSYVEVHMSTSGATFTPDSTTLKGRLVRPGGLAVVGLTAGTTYYFRLRGADPAGNYTSPSTAASGQPGLITAPDIAANAITANSIVAGTITGWSINSAFLSGGTVSGGFITGGTVSGGFISGGTISGGYISGGTVDSSVIRTASSGARIIFNESVSNLASLSFYNSSGTRVMYMQPGSDRLALFGDLSNLGNKIFTTNFDAAGSIDCAGALDVNGQTTLGASGANAGLRVASTGEVYSYGIDDNTTTSAANVRIGTNAQLLKSTSTVRLKDQLTPLEDDLADVPPDKLADFAPSVDPYDVLTVTPTEFRSLSPADADARSLGFIAEDIAAKFPWAANWDEDGIPSAVEDRPILAALLCVVREQQATITDLRTRIEALEA